MPDVGVPGRTVSGVSIGLSIHMSMLAAARVSIVHSIPNASATGPRVGPAPPGLGWLHRVRVRPFVATMLLIQVPTLALH